MKFANPEFLWLLTIIPLFAFYWKKKMTPPALRLSITRDSMPKYSNPILLSLLLKCVALAFFVLALARPQNQFKHTERTVPGLDIVMVMDVSASMNIEDLAERPRLDIAKETMKDFVAGRSNDRIGFVIFSGEPLTLVPPTLDYGIVLSSIDGVETGRLKDGTAIGDGLSLAIGRLRESKAKSKVIILLTDGDNNVGQVDPATAGDLAAGYGIKVYTIAIGKEGRVRLPIREKGMFGKVFTRYQDFDNALNPELLQQIANTTGGKFYRVTEEDALSRVFKEIDSLEKTEIKTQEKTKYEEKYAFPLTLALLVLSFEWFFSFWIGRLLW
ncbi:MAG: VWA domain-containing protein [Xanthomonadaceae bacterium]|nr:VWA domain-containing protein [Xanthomonadaceae bacterium]